MGPQLISPLCDPRARFVRPIEPRRIHLTDHYLFRARRCWTRLSIYTRIAQNALTDDPFNASFKLSSDTIGCGPPIKSDQLHFCRDFLKVPSHQIDFTSLVRVKGLGDLIAAHYVQCVILLNGMTEFLHPKRKL